MRSTPNSRWTAIVLTGSVFSLLSGCPLPSRYFEQTTQAISTTLADQLVSQVILDVFGIDISDAFNGGDTTGDGG